MSGAAALARREICFDHSSTIRRRKTLEDYGLCFKRSLSLLMHFPAFSRHCKKNRGFAPLQTMEDRISRGSVSKADSRMISADVDQGSWTHSASEALS